MHFSLLLVSHCMYVVEGSISTAGTDASGALWHSVQWGFPNQVSIREAKRADRSLQLVWYCVVVADKTWAGPEAAVNKPLTPSLPRKKKESLREHYQSGHGMAIGAA